jgi:biopolymer transport protein ExbB
MHLVGHLKYVLLDLHAAWLMWILVGLSAASIVVMIERALFFRGLRVDVAAMSRDLDRLLRQSKYREAVDLCRASRAPEAAIVLAGLLHADLGPTFLATLGNNAPFVGLLGTVIGVIEAFESLGKPDPTGGLAALGPQPIMTGISEALVATAVGLFVAIPAVAAYNFFNRRIQGIMASSDALSNLLLAHLSAEDVVLASPRANLEPATDR